MSPRDQILTTIANQTRETVKQEARGITVRMATVHCGDCNRDRPLVHLYKCLYCEIYFCKQCAENHFGKTVKQYQEENPL